MRSGNCFRRIPASKTIKVHKSLTGKQTEALFRRYGVFGYLREFYEMCCIRTGYQYINNDIDIYLKP